MPKQLKLTEVLPPELSSRSMSPAYFAPVTLHEDVEADGPAVPLSHYLWIFRRHVWKIVAVIATCVLATFVVSARLQPIYQSTATVNVDRQAPSEVVGEDSTRFVAPNDADQFLATQIKLIQSDAVLRPVAEQYHLLSLEGQTSSASTEREQLLASAPITLKRLRVTRSPNTYLLLLSYRSPDAHLAADVANAIANSYLLQTYDLRIRSAAGLSSFMEKQLDELKAERQQLVVGLKKPSYSAYERIRKKWRGGSAVAEVTGGRCSGCQILLRPQFFQDLRNSGEMMFCESCGRILYYNPPVSFEMHVATHPTR